MGRLKARPTQPSKTIKSAAAAIRMRRDTLERELACASEWRRLQFDAVQSLIEAQRTFLDLHTQIIGLLGRDRPLYAKLRLESIEVMHASEQIRRLVRDIERVLVEH